MNANMNMNAQPFHLGHRRSSSVPLPQEAFAYAQTHNVYPYMQQQQQHAQMGFGGGYDQHQQLQHQMHQHQQQQQTPQMDGWSQQQQHQQQMQHYAPPHSAAPHPGYTHVPLAHSFFPGAATNPFNFADPAVSGLRRNGGAGVANASAANGDDDQQGNGNGIALPTVPRLTGLTPSNAPPGEGSSPATQSLEPSSASTATPMLHQPSPFRLSLSNTTLFMPQPLNAGVTATSLSASGDSTAAQSTATASRFPTFLGRLPSFSMGIPLSFDTSGGSNTAEGGGEHGAAEGGEFMPPHSFYVNMGMPVDATGAFDGYHFGGNSGGGARHAPSSDYNPRSLQQAALHQRQLTNLGRRASSTQPILERQRAYVLGQLGDGEGNNNNHAHAGYDFSGYEMGMGTMGMFGGADAQHQQQQQPFGGVGADYYADYQHPRGGEEEMRGFRNPFASSSSSSVSAPGLAAADSNSSNAHHPLPSSNSSDTTTDSAGPASPSAVGETSSPAMGTSEKLEAVPPHQLPVHQQGQEHAVARGLELAAGAFPFVGHGEEGLVEGVGANEVNMERNSFVSSMDLTEGGELLLTENIFFFRRTSRRFDTPCSPLPLLEPLGPWAHHLRDSRLLPRRPRWRTSPRTSACSSQATAPRLLILLSNRCGRNKNNSNNSKRSSSSSSSATASRLLCPRSSRRTASSIRRRSIIIIRSGWCRRRRTTVR